MKSLLMLSLISLADGAAAPPAATAPPVMVPPPAPPRPPLPGTSAYDQDRAYRARRLRQECISEPGIRTIIESQDRSRAEARSSSEGQSIAYELGQAVYAVPLDLDRVERALVAQAEHHAVNQTRHNREAIALLRRLSPEDRAIYARRLTPMMAFPLPRPCPSTL